MEIPGKPMDHAGAGQSCWPVKRNQAGEKTDSTKPKSRDSICPGGVGLSQTELLLSSSLVGLKWLKRSEKEGLTLGPVCCVCHSELFIFPTRSKIHVLRTFGLFVVYGVLLRGP